MERPFRSLAALACLATIQICFAQVPAGAPANTTGLCNDGTYTSGPTKKGACRGHKGIKEWYAAATPGTASEKPSTPHAKASATSSTKTPMTAAGPAPAGATGACNDGSYSTATTKKGACRGHQGVKEWYVESPGAAKATVQPAANPERTQPAPSPTSTATNPESSETKPAVAKQSSSTTIAPGGGPGLVWLNTSTNVYHCSGTRYYGQTKAGAYCRKLTRKRKGLTPNGAKSVLRSRVFSARSGSVLLPYKMVLGLRFGPQGIKESSVLSMGGRG